MRIRMSEVKKLETIIAKLEAWQASNRQHDLQGCAAAAKNELMRLLRLLEE